MLAQSFKTAKQLKISDQQLIALQKTLVLFETGKVRHVDITQLKFVGWNATGVACRLKKISNFNMCDWEAVYSCGTVACIGGTAEAVGNCNFDRELLFRNVPLHNLFFPHSISAPWENISVDQAAKAIRNYLTLGRPKWKEVLKAK